MVAIKSFSPLVRDPGGNTVAFDRSWLQQKIDLAVCRSGSHPWPLASEFVAGIALYFRHCYLKTVIDVPDLERAVRHSLHEVGYGELAPHFGAH